MIATPLVDGIRALLPARLQKASLSRAGRLVLEVYHGDKRWLVVDNDVTLLVDRPEAGGEEPPALQGLVRKELVPGALVGVDADRLTFGRADGKERVLIHETRRRVLCACVDDGWRILAVIGDAKPADGRDLRRGRLYTPPTAPEPADTHEAGTGSGERDAASRERDAGSRERDTPPRVRDPLDELRTKLRAEKKRLRRLVDALGRDLEKHGDPAVHEHAGELLKTALHTLQRGDSDVVVTDWDGVTRTLILDPALDGAANLARMFKRAKKAREAIARTAPRLDEARRALIDVDAALASADLANGASLLARPSAGGSARRKAAKAGKRQAWRSFRCGGDVVVRVGRGAKDNDALVKTARGNDVWLHARGMTGAHVIVPSSGADVDPELMLDAAHLAAHFSAARGEARGDVQHTRVKNLKKPAHAPAGLVHVSHESVLHLRFDAARLARILAAEIAAA